MEAANYLKFNRAVQGAIKDGDPLPAMSLASLDDGELKPLHQFLAGSTDAHLPVAIIAGSIT